MALSLAIAAPPVVIAGPAVAEGWTGFYAGGQIGNLDVDYPTSSPLFPGAVIFDGSGIGVGFHAGYSHDFGDFVLGAELSVDFPSVDIELTPKGTPASREVDSLSIVKLKAGYDAGHLMPYALIGYARQEYDNTTGTVGDLTFDGMAYGVGMSYLAGPNVVAGIEAVRFDLDTNNPATSLSTEGTLVSLRLSYVF